MPASNNVLDIDSWLNDSPATPIAAPVAAPAAAASAASGSAAQSKVG